MVTLEGRKRIVWVGKVKEFVLCEYAVSERWTSEERETEIGRGFKRTLVDGMGEDRSILSSAQSPVEALDLVLM